MPKRPEGDKTDWQWAESPSIPSDPPPGMLRVVNIYLDPETGLLHIQYDDAPVE